MRILMVTNTFTPHVGGVAQSVQGFTAEFRKRGHQVLVLAPVFAGTPEQEQDVIRMPAVQHFNGSDFASLWTSTRRRLAAEWKILRNIAQAATDAVLSRHTAENP